MGQRRENNSHDAREEKLGELGRAFAAVVLAGDEICHRVSDAVDAVDALVQSAGMN